MGSLIMKRVPMIAFVCASLLCIPCGGWGAEGTPDEERLPFITSEELKELMDSGKELDLINALSHIEFTQTKIPGSISIPYGHLRKGSVALSADKDRMLVFYCKGPK